MDITPENPSTALEPHRSSYELFQALGLLALVVGCVLAVLVVGMLILQWWSGGVLNKPWEPRVAWCGGGALFLTLAGVVAKSYGNRANRANASHARRAAPTHASSTLVVARSCNSCSSLNVADAAVCTRCGAPL